MRLNQWKTQMQILLFLLMKQQKNATNAAPLKQLSIFWRPREMSLIYDKVELKLKWTKYFVLYALGTENNLNDHTNGNIIFTIKDT